MRTALFPIVLTASAAFFVQAGFVNGQFTPFVVEDSGGGQSYPRAGGSVIVWNEFSNGQFIVRGKNIATGNVFEIAVPGFILLNPDTNGSIVTWSDNRTGQSALYAMDIQSGQQWAMGDGITHSNALSEDYVIWTSGVHVYALDLSTGQQFSVCDTNRIASSFDVSGNIVVWQDPRKTYLPLGNEVYGCDIETGQKFLIASDSDYKGQSAPAIGGDIVVWGDSHAPQHIMAYDMSKDMKFAVSMDPADNIVSQVYADTDGRYVVWLDDRKVDGVTIRSIRGYDLVSSEEFLIATLGGLGEIPEPKISGNLVVWSSYPDPEGSSRIMAAYIPEPASVALLAAGAAMLAARRARRGARS